MNSSVAKLLSVLAIAGTAFTVGCARDSGGSSGRYDGTAPHARPGADYTGATRTARETPAPETKPATTTTAAPRQPAAAASANVMYLPTGDRSSSALMIEKIFPTTVSVGQPFEYMIRATNISGNSLDNVTVNEAVPSNFTLQSATPQGANGVYNLGTLTPGESKLITLKGAAASVAPINSCASASYTTALCSTINVVQAALAITKTLTPESILTCQPINMVIEVRNTGTGPATNVRVRDTLPAGLTLASGGSTLDEAVGTIAPGESRRIERALKAEKIGRYENVATATADGNINVSTAKVPTVVRQPVLAIECKPGTTALIGRDACYDLTVTNKGDAAAANSKIAVTLPAGATVSNASDGGTASGNVLTFNIGNLAAGATKTVRFCLRSAAVATLNIAANATADCAAPVATNCSVNVIGVPDLGTLVTDDDGVVVVGTPHTIRVEVANQGQINLTNTRMVITLPEGLEYVSSPNNSSIQGRVLTFDFGTVTPDTRIRTTFVVRATKAGEMLITAETTCNEIRTPIRDDELTVFIDR
jgi:uncharacterized repeat protein (TIGR01451 family)